MINRTNNPNGYPYFRGPISDGMGEAFLASTHKKPVRGPARIGLIGPDTIERDCIGSVVRKCPGVEWTGTWNNINAALNEPAHSTPEILIIYGIEYLPLSDDSQEPDKGPFIVVVLRGHDLEQAREAFDRGAQSCITENDSKETLAKAIEEAARGETFMSDPIRNLFLKGMFVFKRRSNHRRCGSPNALSVREAEIFHFLGHGKSTSDIARDLTLSIKTVQAYCARVKEKRGFASLHELQVAATRQAG
jgi:DNA-binding NarL/FixJ family response regulator